MGESTTKTKYELLFSFFNVVSVNFGKIRALVTWSQFYDLSNISRANSEKKPNDTVRATLLFVMFVSNFTADQILYQNPLVLFGCILSFLLLNWARLALFPYFQ